MSHHESSLKAQFYLTAPQSCAYLEGREERKVFTTLSGPMAGRINNSLSQKGFRRSQSVIYRPACVGCSACMSIRIPVWDFKPNRTQKRVLARNAHLVRRPCEAWATETQFALFRRYLNARHADGGMADMDAYDYASMVDETPVNSTVVEYAAEDPETGTSSLVAACLSDVLSDGLSMVYSFFEPSLANQSLGSFMILDHLDMAKAMGLDYVYLGYWVSGSRKMDYKIGYKPFEICDGNNWHRFSDRAEVRRWQVERFRFVQDSLGA